MSLVYTAFFCRSRESAKAEVKHLQTTPSQSLLPFDAFSVPSVPQEPKVLREENLLQEEFRNVQVLGGRAVYFLTIFKHSISLKTSSRN